MALRVTAVQVKDLVPTEILDRDIVSSYITMANTLVEEHLLAKGHSAKILALIELFLAAHFLLLAEERGGLIKTSLGDSASDSMADVYGVGFNSTRYGQQAITVDVSGTLAAMSTTKLKAEFKII